MGIAIMSAALGVLTNITILELNFSNNNFNNDGASSLANTLLKLIHL